MSPAKKHHLHLLQQNTNERESTGVPQKQAFLLLSGSTVTNQACRRRRNGVNTWCEPVNGCLCLTSFLVLPKSNPNQNNIKSGLPVLFVIRSFSIRPKVLAQPGAFVHREGHAVPAAAMVHLRQRGQGSLKPAQMYQRKCTSYRRGCGQKGAILFTDLKRECCPK